MGAEPLKVGVIGCGFVAQDGHIPSILKCKNVKLVALCDANEELVRKVGKKFRIGKYYTDFKEMLDSEKPDLVHICTPINTHAPLAIQAMEVGCHVFTEKPLALNTSEADEMIKVAKKNGVKLSLMHNMLFLPTVMKMRSIVNKGDIGDLVRVEIRQSCPPQDFRVVADPNYWGHRLPGGIHGDSLPHPIYLARAFLGDIEPTVVRTWKVGNLKHLKYDEVQIILEGKNGMATIINSQNYPSLLTIDVFGTKMNIHANLYNSVVITYRGKTDMGRGFALLYAMQNLNRSLQILSSTFSIGVKLLLGRHRGLPIAIKKFIESIQNGTEPPVSAEDGREELRILEKITSHMV